MREVFALGFGNFMFQLSFLGAKNYCLAFCISFRVKVGLFYFYILSFFLFLSTDRFLKEYTTYPENDTMVICSTNLEDRRKYFVNMRLSTDEETTTTHRTNILPMIYFVTPTYPRREQIPELTRLAQTLLHIRNIHWIVADDTDMCNNFLDHILNRFGK